MFDSKKTIPSLAAGAMALAGCGDSAGGSGSVEQAIQSFCMKGGECGYDVSSCVSQLTNLAENSPENCTSAGLSYLSCGTSASCTAWMSDPIAGCESQSMALGTCIQAGNTE